MSTLTDVAKVAGVGIMSVSRVVNGTRKVSIETEQKVRLAIERIGYEPNEAARILKGQRSSVLGLIVPDLSDPFFAACANIVQEMARRSGFVTWMAASAHNEEVERELTRVMMQRHVAGLLVVPTGRLNKHFQDAVDSGIPVISLDRPLENVTTDSFVVDNHRGAMNATEHLIGHGHQSILCVTDDERIFTKVERVAGYSQAMRRAKLPVQICTVGSLTGSFADQFPYILKNINPPTSIFAESNVMAVDVLRELQRRGMKIPGRMALIAFDDFDAATLVTPPITVIKQPIAELGRMAAELLCGRLDGSRESQVSSITLRTELVIRESCGCKPGSNVLD